MRFARRRGPRPPRQSLEGLVGRTRIRIAVFTLLLVTALVAAVGLSAAAVAIRAMDASVDGSLRESASAAMSTLGTDTEDAGPNGLPTESEDPGASPEPGESAAPAPAETEGTDEGTGAGASSGPGETVEPAETGNAEGGESGDDGGNTTPTPAASTPRSSPAASAPAIAPIPVGTIPPLSPSAAPSPTAAAAIEPDDHIPASADTFFLVLDPAGSVVSNPRRVALGGLPDLAAVAAAKATGEDIRNGTADGAPVRLLTQPIVDAGGKTTGFLQTAFVLKLYQSQVDEVWQRIILVSLIGLVGATLVTLLVTQRALSPIRTAFATERRFVAAASHELRTPAAVIRASAEILQREDLIQPEGRRFVADVISESDRLARLVGDLLALSSVQAGAISMHPRRLDLRAFVRDLAGRARSMASSRNVAFALEEGDTPRPWVQVDPERLEQLLMIFIDNAVDHSPEEGTVRLVLGNVSEAGRPQLSLSVIDQGPGVPEAERSHVFEPFARLSGRRRSPGGTGLGLAIARALAERLDATLRVGEAPGGGAVFSVLLRSEAGS